MSVSEPMTIWAGVDHGEVVSKDGPNSGWDDPTDVPADCDAVAVSRVIDS
jgi:hypothetical protein